MLIGIIKDSDVGYENLILNNPKTRIGARGIVVKDNKIAIFNKKNKNEFKLPGGGVEEGEDFETAFKREIMEETGCEVEIVCKLGEIEEHKTQNNFKQISHVFVGKVINDTNQLHMTTKEIDEGGRLLWCDIDKALELVGNCFDNLVASEYESVYFTKFIVKRDYKILQEYKKYLENQKNLFN